MRVLRRVLILLLAVSLPVSAIGAMDGRMPCERGSSRTDSVQTTTLDFAHASPHVHPAQPAQTGSGTPTMAGETAAIGDHAGHAMPCPCDADCDTARCATANHTTAVIDLGHLIAALTATAAPNHEEQRRLTTPPTRLLRPPIAI